MPSLCLHWGNGASRRGCPQLPRSMPPSSGVFTSELSTEFQAPGATPVLQTRTSRAREQQLQLEEDWNFSPLPRGALINVTPRLGFPFYKQGRQPPEAGLTQVRTLKAPGSGHQTEQK